MLLSVFLFAIGRHSPTLQCRLELRVEHQTVTDWLRLRGSLLGQLGVGETCLASVVERPTET